VDAEVVDREGGVATEGAAVEDGLVTAVDPLAEELTASEKETQTSPRSSATRRNRATAAPLAPGKLGKSGAGCESDTRRWRGTSTNRFLKPAAGEAPVLPSP